MEKDQVFEIILFATCIVDEHGIRYNKKAIDESFNIEYDTRHIIATSLYQYYKAYSDLSEKDTTEGKSIVMQANAAYNKCLLLQ